VAADRVQRVIPDGRADLLVYDSGRLEVTGLHDRVDLPVLPAQTRIWGVRFRPEAVGAAFRTSGESLRNLTISAEDLFGTAQASRLRNHSDLDRWLRGVEPDPRAAAAVRLLASHSVLETADRLGITDRQLRRVMLNTTGMAPKAYQLVLRLQRFLALAPQRPGLARAAADAGYSDQAHLTRDAKTLTGLTPARLLAHQIGP
jgi:AraC-like DNA-binding protein